MIRLVPSTTSNSTPHHSGAPVRAICAERRSISANASAAVRCSLITVASRAFSEPHGWTTRNIIAAPAPDARAGGGMVSEAMWACDGRYAGSGCR